ncbi:MAG: hypothetical protein HEP71_24175 [Roseivirga sp.]|nr:hypothetical protein [Roseivirga sp.]
MKVSHTPYQTKCILFICLALFGSARHTMAQTDFKWCEGIYLGDIRVPTDDYLIKIRNELRSNLSNILSDIGSCKVIERNAGLQDLLKRENNYLDESTISKIVNYSDRFRSSIEWVILGEINEISRNQYSLSLKVINVATFESRIHVKHIFKLTPEFEFEQFNADVRIKFLQQSNQLLKITGRVNANLIKTSYFQITPPPLHGSLQLNRETNRFEFLVPKYSFRNNPLKISISGNGLKGQLDPDSQIEANIPLNFYDVGFINLTSTKGRLYRFKWQSLPEKCNDFRLEVSMKDKNQSGMTEQIQSNSQGDFVFEVPKGLSMGTELRASLVSDNYKFYTENIVLNFDEDTYMVRAGTRKKTLARKFIPGLHQWHHSPRLLSPIIMVAQVGTLWAHIGAKNRANQQRREASISTSFLTRQQLLNSASTNDNIATSALIATIATYAFNWFHASFLRPCKTDFGQQKYSLTSAFSEGRASIGLVIPIG